MAEAIRGRAVSIVAPDADASIVTTPTGKEFKITRMLLSNNGPGVARVRIWDTFTETDATAHSSSALPVLLEDRNLQAGETAEILEKEGIVTALGTLVAQSTVAAAFPNDVIVGTWGEFE